MRYKSAITDAHQRRFIEHLMVELFAIFIGGKVPAGRQNDDRPPVAPWLRRRWRRAASGG